MFTPKGKFGWYELIARDAKAAGKFYSVVGWTTREMPGNDGPQYTTFNLGEVGMAGMLNIPGHVGLGRLHIGRRCRCPHRKRSRSRGRTLETRYRRSGDTSLLPSCRTRRVLPL